MTDRPIRIQLSRAKGFNLQATSRSVNGLECIKVDRTTKWGNPFVVGKSSGLYTGMVKDRRHAWQLFRSIALTNDKMIAAVRAELSGKNLACCCPLPTQPYEPDCCHAAVLLEIASLVSFERIVR
jgi:Domain of unknown function (DUF4326)